MGDYKINRNFRLECTQLIGEISAIAVMVNNFTDYCAFIDFYGHVEQFKITICESKNRYNTIYTQDEIYISAEKWGEEKEVIKKLESLKLQLRNILATNEIEFEGLNCRVFEEKVHQLI